MNAIQQRNADLARAKSRVEADSDADRELARLRLHLADAKRTEERMDHYDAQIRAAMVEADYPVDPSPHAEAHLLAAPVAIRELGAERDQLRAELAAIRAAAGPLREMVEYCDAKPRTSDEYCVYVMSGDAELSAGELRALAAAIGVKGVGNG